MVPKNSNFGDQKEEEEMEKRLRRSAQWSKRKSHVWGPNCLVWTWFNSWWKAEVEEQEVMVHSSGLSPGGLHRISFLRPPVVVEGTEAHEALRSFIF